MPPVVVFDRVFKKFRRGERHDSLRDLVPSLIRGVFRSQPATRLTNEEFWALQDVSFEVEPGEALGIIGANGAGKSTTLKVLTRILKPTSGQCTVRGRIGALIEVAAGFHPELTGRENVYLQGAIMGMKRAEIASRFSEIVEFAGVGDFIDTQVKRYSSGMNARLGFSIAAHLNPDVLIIDEVLSVGDMAFQEKCFNRMMHFKRQGIAIVLVSHNLQAVATVCERTVYLAGSVKASGPTQSVLNAYVRASEKLTQGPDDRGIRIRSVSFIASNEAIGAAQDVASGTPLTLRVNGQALETLDDVTFGLLIHRSADQLLVYNGHVHRREIGTASAFANDFSVDLHFHAHLVRGHYYVSLQISHNPTQEWLISPRQIATLTVRENRSRAGIANLDFSATVGRAADVVSFVE